MGYGQHQSFYLRDRWLNKALRHLNSNDRFFYDKEAFEKMGLGKNMVQSLRFWVVATGMVEETFDENRKKLHSITELGNIVYEFDRFLQFNDTAAIIHYNLSKQKEPGTVWYWFFNVNKDPIIHKEELLKNFIIWVNSNEEKTVSERSLKRDIDCLINLYTAGQSADDPEEVIQSPIHKVNLLTERKGMVYKINGTVQSIGLTALMYCLLDYREKYQFDVISVDEISNNEGLWGKVFTMSRTAIVNALEQLTNHPIYPIRFTRTNNLDTVRLPNVSPLELLKYEFARKVDALTC